MRKYYYIKFNKDIGDMEVMKRVLKEVHGSHYIIDFVYYIEDNLDVEIIEIDRFKFDILLNAN
jgi:hypothetical protein